MDHDNHQPIPNAENTQGPQPEGRPLMLWLGRQYDGNYMITAAKPVKKPVRGAGYHDLYAVPGDPINVRGLCPLGVHRVFGPDSSKMICLGVRRVRLAGRVDPTQEFDHKEHKPALCS